jgi:hypothetical protein
LPARKLPARFVLSLPGPRPAFRALLRDPWVFLLRDVPGAVPSRTVLDLLAAAEVKTAAGS